MSPASYRTAPPRTKRLIERARSAKLHAGTGVGGDLNAAPLQTVRLGPRLRARAGTRADARDRWTRWNGGRLRGPHRSGGRRLQRGEDAELVPLGIREHDPALRSVLAHVGPRGAQVEESLDVGVLIVGP